MLWCGGGPRWPDLENACRGPSTTTSLVCSGATRRTAEALAAYAYDAELVAQVEPCLALFLATWTIPVERAPSPGARAELPGRIDRATRG